MNRIASRYKRVINWYKKTEHASIRRAVNNTVVYDYGYSCIVHSKLDYCNSLYHSLPNCQLNRLQQIQNSLARAVVKAPKSTHHSHYQISALAQGQRTHWIYIFFSLLPTKFLQPVNLAIFTTWSLFNPLALPAPCHRFSPSLMVGGRKKCASTRLRNQLPDSFRQPRQSCLDLPPHSLINPSLSSSLLAAFITPSLFHFRLKTYLFNKSFAPW